MIRTTDINLIVLYTFTNLPDAIRPARNILM